jgi:hypothetical protein
MDIGGGPPREGVGEECENDNPSWGCDDAATELPLVVAVTGVNGSEMGYWSTEVEVEAVRQVVFAAEGKGSTRFRFFEEDGVDVWAMGTLALSAVGLFAVESGLGGVERLRAGNGPEPVFAISATR